MKAFFYLLLCIGLSGYGQTIEVSTHQTTSLIFPYAIRHVDRGTATIIVQDIPASPNVLLVKAGVADFTPTNLSVVTTDGAVYVFAVCFNPTPASWVVQVPPKGLASVATYCNAIAVNLLPRGVRDKHFSMTARVSGIYIKDRVIYYQLQLENTSPVDYDIDFIRFYIRDKRKSKRTAAQEIEMVPIHITGNTATVRGHSKNTIVVALEKFTVPDAKYLAIEINEKNGGRHLLLKIGNRHITKAIPLPDLK